MDSKNILCFFFTELEKMSEIRASRLKYPLNRTAFIKNNLPHLPPFDLHNMIHMNNSVLILYLLQSPSSPSTIKQYYFNK